MNISEDFKNHPEGYAGEEQEKRLEGVYETPEELEVDWEAQTEYEREALSIVFALKEGGGEAYFAGGYGRDLAMSLEEDTYPDFRFNPHDIDIATNLPYQEVKKILQEHGYSKFKESGENFTVLNIAVELVGRNVNFEVASFRTEGDYGKDRKPRTVAYTSDIREDAARRDFTIGGLYFDPVNKKVIDYVGGLRDIKERVLRTIGDPYERLVSEDPLRMLRYVRFLAKYNMKFDREIQQVIRENANVLRNLPAERFKGEQGELDKILTSKRVAFALNNMARVGILDEILPEAAQLRGVRHTPEGKKAEIHKEGDVFRHELESMRAIDRPEFLEVVREKLGIDSEAGDDETLEEFYRRYGADFAWTVLLHDIGKKEAREEVIDEEGEVSDYHFHGHEKFSAQLAEKIFFRFKFSNKSREKVDFLVANHMKAHHITETRGSPLGGSARNTLFRSGHAEELLFLNLADNMGNFADNRSVEDKIDNFKEAWQMLEEFRREEGDREEALSKDRKISNQIVKKFIPEEARDRREGFPVMGPIKDITKFMLDEGHIERSGVDDFLQEVWDLLQNAGIDYVDVPRAEVGTLKKEVQRILEEKYKPSQD